jgi:hypothetical protein
MNLSENFRILHIARRATGIITKNRSKKATENSTLAIFPQRSVVTKTILTRFYSPKL